MHTVNSQHPQIPTQRLKIRKADRITTFLEDTQKSIGAFQLVRATGYVPQGHTVAAFHSCLLLSLTLTTLASLSFLKQQKSSHTEASVLAVLCVQNDVLPIHFHGQLLHLFQVFTQVTISIRLSLCTLFNLSSPSFLPSPHPFLLTLP